ncbi:tRNA threonylcarbamoyladenosine dehydratase [Lachnospira multipara]|uniref:tRNA threonylcarbamoyladenosine dehydratase n=1 Tax=Lachnospira multipara TaxID=28051 RepID=UPI0004E0B5C3|nr:tRNA threonylcarbamoyladenosine dehydratase [Lachnospira multipara]
MERFKRTEVLLGSDALYKLNSKRVCIFGVGGVGGYVVEALVRAGIGHIDIVDKDVVSESNINRQIIASYKTIGISKVEAFKERIKDINPDCEVIAHNCFYLPETRDEFDFSQYDYVVDAVDTVTAKIDIIMQAKNANTPVISAMGAGNKLDPTMFEVADIYKTSMCPLAKVMRRELKKRQVKNLKVVYSKEVPISPNVSEEELLKEMEETKKRSIPGSISFVPSVAGLILASEVVKDLIK